MSENRIFIGVKLREEIVEWLQSVLPPHKLLQAVEPVNYHITLLFLGHVIDLDKLVANFADLSFVPFFVSVTSLGAFYKKGKLKIINLRIDLDNNELQHIYQELKSLFGNNDNDQFPVFTPHITLNRNIKSSEVKEIEEFVNYTFPQPMEFEVENLHLMDSANFNTTKAYKVVYEIDLMPKKKVGAMKLTILIQQEDKYLIGKLKEVPAVITQARTKKQLLENIIDALSLYLECEGVDYPSDLTFEEELIPVE